MPAYGNSLSPLGDHRPRPISYYSPRQRSCTGDRRLTPYFAVGQATIDHAELSGTISFPCRRKRVRLTMSLRNLTSYRASQPRSNLQSHRAPRYPYAALWASSQATSRTDSRPTLLSRILSNSRPNNRPSRPVAWSIATNKSELHSSTSIRPKGRISTLIRQRFSAGLSAHMRTSTWPTARAYR